MQGLNLRCGFDAGAQERMTRAKAWLESALKVPRLPPPGAARAQGHASPAVQNPNPAPRPARRGGCSPAPPPPLVLS